jgi:hypothetical protein
MMIRNGLRLSKLTLSITRVGSTNIDTLPTIEMSIVQVHTDGPVLRILHLGTSPAQPPAISPSEQGKQGEAKECAHLPRLCRLRAAAATKFAMLKSHLKGKGCGRHAAKKAAAAAAKGPARTFWRHPHARPHHGHHRQHHHHHQRVNTFFTTLKNTLRTCFQILLPILVGVAAGMTASLGGMIVGTLGVGLYRKFVRGDERGVYEIVGTWDPRSGAEEVLVMEEEPPAYKDEKVGGESEVVVAVDEVGSKQ